MELVVATESRFFTDHQGRWVCADGTYGNRFWQRYRDVFERVIVVARCSHARRESGFPVEGECVEVWPLADGRGAVGAARHWWQWRRQMRPLLDARRAFMLRLPGQIGSLLGGMLHDNRLPYGVEAIGDPLMVFRRGNMRHVLRPGLALYFSRAMRRLCREAAGVSYVTARQLQRVYPASERALVTHYSSVELSDESFVEQPRDYRQRPQPLQLIHVGTMSQRYKGQHHLIDAVGACLSAGREVRLALVGDGRFRPALETQVRRRQLTERVRFLGQLPAGAAVREALDQSDLFVLPSLTEGLPRVLVEAQARALPCLATSVGGIPELLSASECTPAGDPAHLTAALLTLLDDPARLTLLSQQNLARAHRFVSPILRQRRQMFYGYLRDTIDRPRWAAMRRAA